MMKKTIYVEEFGVRVSPYDIEFTKGKIQVVSNTDMASLCGYRPKGWRTAELTGTIPTANIRAGDTETKVGKRPGQRLYSYDMALKVARICRNEIRAGVSTSEETKTKLRQLFAEERAFIETLV